MGCFREIRCLNNVLSPTNYEFYTNYEYMFVISRKNKKLGNMKKRNFVPLVFLVVALAIGSYLLWHIQGKKIEISGGSGFLPSSSELAIPSPTSAWDKSPISGLACLDAQRRPLAVMLSSDAAARPLSGLSEADLVFEMPVITDSITRLMAVFVCGNPPEIGSVRSARHDYIPLARGLDAIYSHWGGSHFALDKLDAGIMNNIDALKNPFNAFWRKSGVASPHNGFTSLRRLLEATQKLGYHLEGKFSGYPHLSDEEISASGKTAKSLNIGFGGAFQVRYDYDPAADSYLRYRGGSKEIDKNNSQPIVAKNVVIMRAPSRQIEGQYNDVAVEGEGKAMVYRDGEEIAATWKKNAKDQTSKLYFYDNSGQEIKFSPGQIWIEVVEPSQSVTWK